MALARKAAKSIVESMPLLKNEDKVALKCTSESTFIKGEDNQPDRHLVNFFATTPDKIERAKTVLAELDAEGAEDYQDVANAAGLSYGIPVPQNGGEPFVPEKKETVDAELSYVENQEGELVLRITSINKRKARSVQTTASLEDDEEEKEPSEQGEDLGEGEK